MVVAVTRPLSAKIFGPPVVAVTMALTVLLSAGSAAATWSIIAVDPETGRVGAAMASCVPSGLLGEPDSPLVPVVLMPGIGVAVTQGSINPDSPGGLRLLLTEGFSPTEAIDELLDIDEVATARQYGAVLLAPAESGEQAVTFTGADVEAIAGGTNRDTVAVQGLLLAEREILAATMEAYEAARAESRTIEQALLAGLAAGSALGGDRRCDSDQTALFAHLAVAGPEDDPLSPSVLLTVTVDEGDGQNPVPMLVDAFDRGESGWVDAGLITPTGVPRVAVGAVGLLMAIAAWWTIRKGLGSTAARR
jgi:uncharacterized Ntn-hydrolase superfamily protein